MNWCDIIEVRLGLSWFVFGVVWCLIVRFDVILQFLVRTDVLLCGFGVIWF